ncbi:hypothetical protein CTI14_72250, partial [Methylobacterium radiotolerans]
TGTNGKTTTSRMIAHIFKGIGRKVGMTSTDGIVIDTGTNGKTTTSRMIAHIFKGIGRKVGMTSTDGIV